MGTTTAMCTSFKQQLMQAMHNFTATLTPTGNTNNTNQTVSSVSSTANISRGMPISGAGVPAGAFVADIPTSTTLLMSAAATATASGVTLTISGDVFNIALVKLSPTGAYGAATTNYSNLTGNSDEVSGTGYTATGAALTNVTPTTSGTTAYTTFSPNPSWTSASFSCTGGIIYNTTTRGGVTGQSVSVHDFGGTQTVSSGTFTAVMPTANSTNAILRIQ